MAEAIFIKENHPYPNNFLPVLYYPSAIKKLTASPEAAQEVQSLLEENGYLNSWIDGIFSYHHFHSNTHEVLACLAGEAEVQLGGPDANVYIFKKGDILLLPAGTAHKRIDATEDFKIIGAYPNGIEPDLQKGNLEEYSQIKKSIAEVTLPEMDPVGKKEGATFEHWKSKRAE